MCFSQEIEIDFRFQRRKNGVSLGMSITEGCVRGRVKMRT